MTSPAKKGADHGDFPFMHSEMSRMYQQWLDEFCLREHGFKLSELQRIETLIARFGAHPNPSAELREELASLREEYATKWYPLRMKLSALW